MNLRLWQHAAGALAGGLGLLWVVRQIVMTGDANLGLVLGTGVACVALPCFWLALRRSRALQMIAISRIGSAPQGYVALTGIAKALPGSPTISPLNLLPCLWYRVSIQRGEGNNRETVDYESDDSFVLSDGEAECVIDPAGAEIHARHKETRRNGRDTETHWLILPGDTLYVQGDLRTLATDAHRSEREIARELLADWKTDRESLHQRFDLDRNGEIDMREWSLVRTAAEREARQRRIAAAAQPDMPVLQIPADSRPYLISAHSRADLLGVARVWGGLAAVGFLLATGLVGWALHLR